MSGPLVLVVATGERPLLLNRERNMHHMGRAAIVTQWKHEAIRTVNATARGATMARAGLSFFPVYPTAQLPDLDGPLPTYKAILDGMVHAGVLPDDTPAHVEWFSMEAPTVDRGLSCPVVRVVAREVAPVVGHGLGECDCRGKRERAQARQELARASRR